MGLKFRQGIDREALDAVVMGNKVGPGAQDGRHVDSSQCCQVWQEVYCILTQKRGTSLLTSKNVTVIGILMILIQAHVWEHESYTMGYCNPK